MVARTSALAAGQWGLFTSAQAEAEGITRLQLARLTDAGVIERVDRGIYAAPAAVDERTPLRAAWLSLEPARLAEERLTNPVATGVMSHTSAAALHGIGNLLDDEPEVTMPDRKQSRRGIRLHRAALDTDEVTIAEGLPVTTPARTVADFLRDGRDPSHVAEIAGDVLRRGLASRQDMATALEPLARRNGQPTGAALLEHLLDLVGLSSTALATNLLSSDLGKTLIAAGQLGAIRSIMGAVSTLGLPEDVLRSLKTAALSYEVTLPQPPAGVLPKIDISAIIEAAELPISVDTEAFTNALATKAPAWLPEIIRTTAMDSRSSSSPTSASTNDEVSI